MNKLEEAANAFADEHGFRVPYNVSGREITNDDYYDKVDLKASKDGFLAGAEWQKNNMWIDVEKDGYPEYKESYSMLNNKYIVIVECQNMYLNKAVTISSLTSHSHFNVEMNSNTAVIKVTHWMPIPEMKKGE